MAINTKGPANKKPGTRKGKAVAPKAKKGGFDLVNEYAPFSKTQGIKTTGKASSTKQVAK